MRCKPQDDLNQATGKCGASHWAVYFPGNHVHPMRNASFDFTSKELIAMRCKSVQNIRVGTLSISASPAAYAQHEPSKLHKPYRPHTQEPVVLLRLRKGTNWYFPGNGSFASCVTIDQFSSINCDCRHHKCASFGNVLLPSLIGNVSHTCSSPRCKTDIAGFARI